MDSTPQNCNGIVWRQTVRPAWFYNLEYRFRGSYEVTVLFLQLKLKITLLKCTQIETNQIKTCQNLYRDSIMLLVTDSIDWNSDRVGHKTIANVLHRRTYPKDVHSYRHFLSSNSFVTSRCMQLYTFRSNCIFIKKIGQTQKLVNMHEQATKNLVYALAGGSTCMSVHFWVCQPVTRLPFIHRNVFQLNTLYVCCNDFYRPRSEEIMYLVASVRPSVCPSVRPSVNTLTPESLPVWSVCLCVCNQSAYADNHADAVDRLLIFNVHCEIVH